MILVISVTCGMKKWVKVFNYGPSKICGRQPLKIFDPNIC